jgi:hypothetical protein
METKFIKVGDRYLIKDSNAIYVSEAEMKKIIKDERTLADITSNDRQDKQTKKESVANANSGLEPIKPDVK